MCKINENCIKRSSIRKKIVRYNTCKVCKSVSMKKKKIWRHLFPIQNMSIFIGKYYNNIATITYNFFRTETIDTTTENGINEHHGNCLYGTLENYNREKLYHF